MDLLVLLAILVAVAVRCAGRLRAPAPHQGGDHLRPSDRPDHPEADAGRAPFEQAIDDRDQR